MSNGIVNILPGQSAQSVQPNPKCEGCLHYNSQGGQTGVCTIGFRPWLCGDGDAPDMGYSPVAAQRPSMPGSFAPLAQVGKPGQSNDAPVENYRGGASTEVPITVSVLGAAHVGLVKSIVNEREVLMRSVCALHQSLAKSSGQFSLQYVQQSCTCNPVSDIEVAKALVPLLSNADRQWLTAEEIVFFVKSVRDGSVFEKGVTAARTWDRYAHTANRRPRKPNAAQRVDAKLAHLRPSMVATPKRRRGGGGRPADDEVDFFKPHERDVLKAKREPRPNTPHPVGTVLDHFGDHIKILKKRNDGTVDIAKLITPSHDPRGERTLDVDHRNVHHSALHTMRPVVAKSLDVLKAGKTAEEQTGRRLPTKPTTDERKLSFSNGVASASHGDYLIHHGTNPQTGQTGTQVRYTVRGGDHSMHISTHATPAEGEAAALRHHQHTRVYHRMHPDRAAMHGKVPKWMSDDAQKALPPGSGSPKDVAKWASQLAHHTSQQVHSLATRLHAKATPGYLSAAHEDAADMHARAARLHRAVGQREKASVHNQAERHHRGQMTGPRRLSKSTSTPKDLAKWASQVADHASQQIHSPTTQAQEKATPGYLSGEHRYAASMHARAARLHRVVGQQEEAGVHSDAERHHRRQITGPHRGWGRD